MNPHATNPPGAAPVNPRRRFLAAVAAALGVGALAQRPRAARAATQSSEPYVGEILLWAGNFAPLGWLPCDGSLLPISQFEVLFSLLGTTYGGDGQVTFALPDLRGRIPLHMGTGPTGAGYQIGQRAGTEQTTLLTTQLPAHTHAANGLATAGTSDMPGGLLPARNGAGNFSYGAGTAATLAATHLASTGGGQPHNNMQPYLALNFCIAYEGIYPSRA